MDGATSATTATTVLPPFVTSDWLDAHRDEVVLADVRWSLDGSEGHHTHLERALPGAVFVDLDRALTGPGVPTDGRHPLPDPARFAEELGRVGIGGAPVVAYDQGGGAVAARLVWLLRAIGEQAAVLDGGLAAWTGPTVSGGSSRPPVAREVRPWPAELLADADLTAAVAGSPRGLVLDARDAVRYAGEHEPVDPRAGHVPGARNAPYAEHLGADGTLLPLEELRGRYRDLGALAADEVVVYCGSGVTACHGLLVLEALGRRGRLFPPSWSGWSSDADRPAATGPDAPAG